MALCTICCKAVRPRQQLLVCDGCDSKTHRTCNIKMDQDTFRKVNKQLLIVTFECCLCLGDAYKGEAQTNYTCNVPDNGHNNSSSQIFSEETDNILPECEQSFESQNVVPDNGHNNSSSQKISSGGVHLPNNSKYIYAWPNCLIKIRP